MSHIVKEIDHIMKRELNLLATMTEETPQLYPILLS